MSKTRKLIYAGVQCLVTALEAASGAAHATETAPTLPATPQAWRDALVRDIEAGYRVTLANHAGTLDPHNPGFVDHLKAAKAYGESLVPRVNDATGYTAALMAFSNRIHDGHAGVQPTFDVDKLKPVQWPGIVPAWRGDLFVYAAEEGDARRGERIVSCDGKPVRQLLEENVFGYRGRADEEGQWWSQSRYLFRDSGNPFVQRPLTCVFDLAGRRTERTLRWRDRPASTAGWSLESVDGDPLPVGVTEPRTNLFWVAMPSFQPSESEAADYRAMYRRVETQRERFLNADAVVIDLRRNQGGSSMWSHDFAAALWGKERLDRLERTSTGSEEVWYRSSAGNIELFQDYLQEATAHGDVENAQRLAKLVAGMRAARAGGRPYYVDKDEDAMVTDLAAGNRVEPPPFTRPTYVIVPGACVSACLDALDYFKLFPNVKLIGAPSSADSTYMDVRYETLSGGLAQVIIPTKLYVHRPRGNGEFYRPDLLVTDLQWTMATFLDVVERDLARKDGPVARDNSSVGAF